MTSTTKILPAQVFVKDGAIVVGSGLAGLSAASELISYGISVHLLERAAKPGGNSMKASSGINGAHTRFQPGPDEEFYNDTIKSVGKALPNQRERRERLVATLTNSSKDAIVWLTDANHIDLSKVARLGGHSHPRTHRGSGQTPPGASIVTTLLNKLKPSPLFHLRTSCAVTKVLQINNRITGVQYSCSDESTQENVQELYGPVVFASGGFGGDAKGLLAQYRPDLAGFPSTVEQWPGTQPLLTAVGAQLLDMDLVQVHPTGFIDPKEPSSPRKFLAAEVLRGEGGILLVEGKRFVNEMETREHVTNEMMKVATADAGTILKQWGIQIVLDEGTYQAAKAHMDFYLWKGLMQKTTIAELGPEALSTIQSYAKIVSGESDDAYGRTHFSNWTLTTPTSDATIYVGSVTPVVHFTMGGVMINERAEVLDQDGTAIQGLWAAGEVTGGVHGANRLGGSSLLECVVFGRAAGNGLAEYISGQEE